VTVHVMWYADSMLMRPGGTLAHRYLALSHLIVATSASRFLPFSGWHSLEDLTGKYLSPQMKQEAGSEVGIMVGIHVSTSHGDLARYLVLVISYLLALLLE